VGIPNNLNDVLIRHFMKSFAITRFQGRTGAIRFLPGIFSARHARGVPHAACGYKSGFVTTGTFWRWRFFVLACRLGREYGFFLFALFVIASGLSFLETASNPFHRSVGDPNSSERRLNSRRPSIHWVRLAAP